MKNTKGEKRLFRAQQSSSVNSPIILNSSDANFMYNKMEYAQTKSQQKAIAKSVGYLEAKDSNNNMKQLSNMKAGGKVASVASNAIGRGIVGSAIGSFAGPIGTAIGGGIGLVSGTRAGIKNIKEINNAKSVDPKHISQTIIKQSPQLSKNNNQNVKLDKYGSAQLKYVQSLAGVNSANNKVVLKSKLTDLGKSIHGKKAIGDEWEGSNIPNPYKAGLAHAKYVGALSGKQKSMLSEKNKEVQKPKLSKQAKGELISRGMKLSSKVKNRKRR